MPPIITDFEESVGAKATDHLAFGFRESEKEPGDEGHRNDQRPWYKKRLHALICVVCLVCSTISAGGIVWYQASKDVHSTAKDPSNRSGPKINSTQERKPNMNPASAATEGDVETHVEDQPGTAQEMIESSQNIVRRGMTVYIKTRYKS